MRKEMREEQNKERKIVLGVLITSLIFVLILIFVDSTKTDVLNTSSVQEVEKVKKLREIVKRTMKN
jgi:hypothetical protein